MSSAPIKVLCLHGFAQNATLFAAKSSGVRKLLKKQKVETYYVDAPYGLKLSDLPFKLEPEAEKNYVEDELKGWWLDVKGFDIEPSINVIREAIKEKGPFDGIIGFSQGAALAQLVTNEMVSLGNGHPLKFAIYFSGFVPKYDAAKSRLTSKVSIPTLHIMGELDNVVNAERSIEFAEKHCEEGTYTIFKHPGGHYVPNQKDVVKNWVNWVVEQLGERNLDEEKPKKQPKQNSQKKAPAKKMEEKENDDDISKLADEIDKLGTI